MTRRPHPRATVVALLVGLALVAATPAAGAQEAPDQPEVCDPIVDEPSFADDARVESWTGEVGPNVTGGDLEIHSYHSGTYVVPWNRSTWRVEVGEVDPNDALEPSVTGSTDGGALDLTVRVEARDSFGPLGLSTSPDAHAQVKAWVPHRVYDSVATSPGPNGTTLSPQFGTGSDDDGWDALVLGNLTADRARLDGDVSDAHVVGARVGDLDVRTGSGDACIAGLEARTANVTADSGDQGLRDVEARRLEAAAGSGDLVLRQGQVDVLEVTRDSGGAHLADLAADQVTVEAGSGDLAVNGSDLGSLQARLDTGSASLDRVTAETFSLEVGSGDLEVASSNLDHVDASFDSGDSDLRSLTAETVTLTSGSGDLAARGVEVRDLAVTLDSGDVDADLKPIGNGTWNLTADSGELALHVTAGEAYGYDAVLTTDSGEPTIEIPGTEVVERSERRLHVRTAGYEDRTFRTRLRVATDSGDVTADDQVSSSESGFGSDGRTYGVVPSTPQQAVVDAGVLAVLAAVATVAWPKVRTFVAPLYSRIGASEVLHHPVRQEIHDLVQEHPGLHFRELQRRLEAGRGALEHHLDKLVDADVIAEHEADGYTCYFVQGSVSPEVMEVAPLVRAETARALLVAAARQPGASVNALSEAAGVSNSTASYHLDKLQEAGLVVKDRGGNGLEIAPADLGARALEALNIQAELAVSENRA